VGIDHGDKRSSAAAFAQRSGMSYASLVDDSGKALAAFGAAGLPATYVVDQTGRIRDEAIGTVDVQALERSVDLVRSGHPAPAVNASAAPVQVTDVGGRPAPDFTLIDQFGRRTSLSDLRGHPVLLTFVDSRCEDVCRLTADVLRQTRVLLGSDAGRVRLLAVNANPRHFAVADVRAWSAKHGLLNRWRYVTGQPAQLRAIWRSYGVSSRYEHGELEHQALVYVLDRHLGEQSLLSMSSLRTSVTDEAAALAKAVRPLLAV
jgi:cytochrome oxidase Cu insertion factor (SCO1/SenC/PrrC family)